MADHLPPRFLLLADHPPLRSSPWLTTPSPRFCKFEHADARIGKTECFCPWPTTPHLGSANSSTRVLELAKPSVPALGRPPTTSVLPMADHPLTSVLQIRALECSNLQNRAFLPLADHPPTECSCSWTTTHHFGSANSSTRVLELAKRAFLLLADYPSPRFCQFKHASARIGKTESSCPWPTIHPPRFCKIEHASARIGKIERSCSWTTTHHFGSANSSTCVLELAKPSLPTLV